MKDVMNMSRKVRSMGLEYLNPPLLVLASFPPPSPTTPPHLSLLVKSFQSLFPSLSPHTLKLSNARRVVLASYNADRGTIDLRHYLITVKPYGVSKRIRRILEGAPSKKAASSASGMLDLGNEKDVADFLLRKKGELGPDGYESATSSAGSVAGDEENAVDLPDDYVGRNNQKGQRRAVRLDEVGPRLELRLIKIVEGVPGKDGAVIYHDYVKKSKKEVAVQRAEHAMKEKLRQQRREEQERNVARKKAAAKTEHVDDKDESESEEDLLDDDEGEWDENEEISEGEESTEHEDSSDEEEEDTRPIKKARSSKMQTT
jgi:ribosome biogenesis protein SSF1/2